MKTKRLIIYLIALILIAGIIIGIAYSKYILKDQLDISISGAKYYMTVSANKETITPSSSSITLTLNNFDGDNVSNTDIKYALSIDNNKFEINDTTTKTLAANGSNKVSNDVTVTFTPKGGAALNDTESITLTINVTSPYVDSKQISISYKNLQVMTASLKNSYLTILAGTEEYDDVIKANLVVKDDGGNEITDVTKSYTCNPTFNVNTEGEYDVTYTASKTGYDDATIEGKIKVRAIEIITGGTADFTELPLNNLTACKAGATPFGSVRHMTSNVGGDYTKYSADPNITIGLSSDEYFSTQQHRYVKIRIRMNKRPFSNTTYNGNQLMQLFFIGPENSGWAENCSVSTTIVGSTVQPGQWQEITLDLANSPKQLSQITGIRFDWTNYNYYYDWWKQKSTPPEHIYMDIDYIKFISENVGPQAIWQEDFSSTDASYYTAKGYQIKNANYAFSDSRLTICPTNDDPGIELYFTDPSTGNYMALDPKEYRFVTIEYCTDGDFSGTDTMELYTLSSNGESASETYKTSSTIQGTTTYTKVTYDLAVVNAIYNSSEYIGLRLDPVKGHIGKNIYINSISISDRCDTTPINDNTCS